MRAAWCAAALALAACGGADLCAYPELKSDTCITVHVSGDLNTGVKSFDAVQADVRYTLGSDDAVRRLLPTILKDTGMPITLPIAFGIVYPTGAKPTESLSSIRVLLTSGGAPVGYGRKSFILETGSVKPGEHGGAQVDIKPATLTASDCFNGFDDSGESDVDCGGIDCPLCERGKKCFSNTDCASGVCGSSPFVCQ